jgi:ABC-type transport system substrate-binding protein
MLELKNIVFDVTEEDGSTKRIIDGVSLKLDENKFPSGTILYYYDNGFVKPVVTSIVSHWQSNLSAFVNIEAASESELLLPELKDQTLSMAIFPVRADNSDLREYISKYDTNKTETNLSKIQSNILKDTTIVPLFYENTCIAYSSAITTLVTTPGNGYIDFSQIIKDEL